MTLAFYTVDFMSSKGASLAHLPADVFVEITRHLNVHDILTLRRISRRLAQLTRQRPVWQNVLNQACTQHGLPRFLPLLQAQSDEEIEYYACRPAKFQVFLDNFFVAGMTRHPRHQRELPQDEYAHLHLVTGGKWLVTLTTEGLLRVWDLEPYHRINPSSSSLNAGKKSSDRPPPLCCGESCFPMNSGLMDARVSDDGCQLLIFIHNLRTKNSVLLSEVSVSSLDIRGSSTWASTQVPIRLQICSIWSNENWNYGLNVTASFSGPWAVFTHKTWTGSETARTWVWNWKRNISKPVKLQVSNETDGIFRTKIIADYLIVVHKVGKKLNLSVYPLTALQWDDDLFRSSAGTSPAAQSAGSSISSIQDSKYTRHETPRQDAPKDTPTTPDVLTPLFTTKFHGLYHVERYHSRGDNPSCSSSSQGFVRRQGGNCLPFNIATVSISDPYWLTPARPRHCDHGSFRVGIAVESKSEGAFRTRLQYYIRLDLNTLIRSYTLPFLPIVTAPWLGSSGCTDVGAASEFGKESTAGTGSISQIARVRLPQPKLRGRVSSAREAMYFHDRLFIFTGRKKIVSLWSATDGVHAHSSPLFKSDEIDKKARCPPIVSAIPNAMRTGAGLDRPKITVRHRIGGSSQSIPLIMPRRRQPGVPEPNVETFPPMGKDLVIFNWPQSKSRNDKARQSQGARSEGRPMPGMLSHPLSPDSASEDIPETFMPLHHFGFGARNLKDYAPETDVPPDPNTDGRRRDLLGNSLVMMGDGFSGRIVLLDEIEGEAGTLARRMVVRVLDYV